MLDSWRHGDSLENLFTAYRKSSPARWASWASEYPPELSPSTNQPMRRISKDDGIPWAVKAAAIFCGSRSPFKKSPPKQGEHTRFPDHDALDCNVHPADVRPALTDTNHGLNPCSHLLNLLWEVDQLSLPVLCLEIPSLVPMTCHQRLTLIPRLKTRVTC